MNNETITITKKEYDRLVSRDEFLSRLEGAGVDNWEGYSFAFDEEDEEGDQ